MTNTSKLSTDVETMTINDGGNTWDRVRSSEELSSFRAMLVNKTGELDPAEYVLAA